ncbi:myosin heavy chain-like isoform X2 [Branchiostoma floridae]|uniref:Myosin heavy chain-like isoform X2 n=1 Tax=Branchiostoma floridae TaxID=7739 RepID=A0A9J7M0L6_BRAFL|nr:myosin heavy chain-like isoform X2 [Branchiostoma floridae]
MALIRKFRSESTNVEATKVCLNTDKFVSISEVKSEILKMKETNYQLKNSVLILTRSSDEMRREAVKQQSTISLLKKTHKDILEKKDEELANQRIAVTAQRVAQDALTKALNIIIKEQQDTASLTDELLLETRNDLTSSKAEAAKLGEELKTLRAELLMRENDMCQMEELYEKQKRSLQKIHRKEVQTLTDGFEQEIQERNERERFLQEMIIRKNAEIKEVKKEMATMKDIHGEEVKALKESILQLNKDRDDKERLLQQTILLKNEEVAALRRNMKAEKDIHEEELKELQQTIHLDSLFVKDLMTVSSKIECEELERMTKIMDALESELNNCKLVDAQVIIDDEQRMREEMRESMTSQERSCNMLQQELNEARMALELAERDRKRMRNVTEALESECDEVKCKLDQSETKLQIMKEDGERLLSELNSMKTTLLKSWVDRNNETKIMEDRLYSVKAEREIFKVLATAKRNKEDEEEQITSNEHMERSRHHHQEQARYMGQAWQEATSGPCYFYTPDRNHHHHPG